MLSHFKEISTQTDFNRQTNLFNDIHENYQYKIDNINQFVNFLEHLPLKYGFDICPTLDKVNIDIIKSIANSLTNISDYIEEADGQVIREAIGIQKNREEQKVQNKTNEKVNMDELKKLVEAEKIKNRKLAYDAAIKELNEDGFAQARANASSDKKALDEISQIENEWRIRKYYAACSSPLLIKVRDNLARLSEYLMIMKNDCSLLSLAKHKDKKSLLNNIAELSIELDRFIQEEKLKLAAAMLERLNVAEKSVVIVHSDTNDDVVADTISQLYKHGKAYGLRDEFLKRFKIKCPERHSMNKQLQMEFREYIYAAYSESLFNNFNNQKQFLKKIYAIESEGYAQTKTIIMMACGELPSSLIFQEAEKILDQSLKECFIGLTSSMMQRNATVPLYNMVPVEILIKNSFKLSELIKVETENIISNMNFNTPSKRDNSRQLLMDEIINKVKRSLVTKNINQQDYPQLISKIIEDNRQFITTRTDLIEFLKDEVSRLNTKDWFIHSLFMSQEKTQQKIADLNSAISEVTKINSMQALVQKAKNLKSSGAIIIKRGFFSLSESDTSKHYRDFLLSHPKLII
ncbi:MAG: hypothetical protein ACD_46C00291G0007 [uncultured bacterium]|nr:MAG: hypothetical protein ACD_46C00291G0007 [uncultured bacterium]